MKDELLEKVYSWADENGVLKPETLVVAGASGGADSVCLFHVLYKLSSARAFSIVAVHVNHMLRGEESDGDEDFVRELCGKYGIPLHVFREDVAAFANENHYSTEEAGRLIRYRCLREVADKVCASYIAVAHHRDDQAETVFLNLLRGTGIDGLCGMPEISGKIIRPLLRFGKQDIEAYIRRNGLTYRTDSSNYENAYLRNTIRNIIFPGIKLQTGTDISASLIRMQKLLRTDRDFLNGYAGKKFNDILILEENNRVVLERNELKGLHPAIAGRIIRIAWERVSGSLKGLESVHVDMVLDIVSKEGNRTAELPKGVTAAAEYNRVEISARASREKPGPFSVRLEVPSTVDLPVFKIRMESGIFSAEEFSEKFGRIEKPRENSLTQLFDYSKIKEGIYIRNRKPGDIFFPYNSSGRKKLKDFLIDQKIPVSMRDSIPLLADGKNIVWVIGVRTADNYKVTGSTNTILYVNVMKLND